MNRREKRAQSPCYPETVWSSSQTEDSSYIKERTSLREVALSLQGLSALSAPEALDKNEIKEIQN